MKFLKRSIFAFFLGLSLNISAQNYPKEVFLLMGQSNMAGFAVALAEDSLPVNGIYYIPTITNEALAWLPAAHPLHNRLSSDRFGLGLPFAIEYQKNHNKVPIGLIPLAWGGAPIDRLNKGSKTYADGLQKVAFAIKNGAVIKGILWHQGESDTFTDTLTNSYEKKLVQLISDLREDIGNSKLPFVLGNLAEFYGTSAESNKPDRVIRIEKIRQILRSIPSKVKFTAFVESNGCKSPDEHNVHFDRDSYILLGKRYAEKILELQNNFK